MVHRLVYDAFVGDLPCFVVTNKGDKRMEVSHKNEIKSDNRLENLELVTCTQNNNHGTHKQKIAAAISRKVYQYTLDKELVMTWDSQNRVSPRVSTKVQSPHVAGACTTTWAKTSIRNIFGVTLHWRNKDIWLA